MNQKKLIHNSLIISIVTLLCTASLTQAQTTTNSYSVIQEVPIGGSVSYYVPIVQAPPNATITNVEAKFDYTAYGVVQNYVMARFNKGSDPGSTGGVSLVGQGNLPEGNPGTYGWISFSNWNSQQANANYYFRFAVASGSPYTATVNTIYVRVTYSTPQLEIMHPNGGETLFKGTDYNVTWNSSDVSGNVKIEVYRNGSFYQQLGANEANDGSYPFNPPTSWPDGSDYQAAVAALDGSVSDFSDGNFSIADENSTLDGFDFPVGYPDGEGYHHGTMGGTDGWAFLEWTGSVFHPGEDWNGDNGGDTDLGDPVYAVSDGSVVSSDEHGPGWGNIILVAHDLSIGGTVWSQYAHLLDRLVETGTTVVRGQQIGTIGKGHENEYWAHLHFEIRKLDMVPDAWPTSWPTAWTQEQVLAAYYDPSEYISANRPQATSVETNPTPTREILSNYPNPFNPSTTIRYCLPEETSVSLVIYDIRGNTVKTFTSETKAAGWYEIIWNGVDESGQPVSTGLYLTRLQAGSFTKTIKMLYLK